MHQLNSIRFRRRHLPHWEVEARRYFITVRCADSLPAAAMARLQELAKNLAEIEPRSDQCLQLQREAFRTMEKYLDAGLGSCPLRLDEAAAIVIEEPAALTDWGVCAKHYTVMPNHWHALIETGPHCSQSLSAIMKRVKGRTRKRIRAVIGGKGPLWQGEWFDRWMRSDADCERAVAYIRGNPVKAGLVAADGDHPWTQ